MKVLTDPVLIYASRIAYSSLEVLQFTYDMGLRYKNSPGCYVEAGCAAGAQVIALAHSSPNKTIYAFDSFEGIPLPSNRDDQMPGIKFLTKEEQEALPNPGEQVLESSGATSVSYEDFWNHLDKSGINTKNIWGIEGWFEDTLPFFVDDVFFQNTGISLLRLDGDLYNSTYVCLKYLYPKVIKGACVIIDDWALPGCKWAVIEYMGEMGENPDYKVIQGIDSQMCYWIK